MNRRIARTIASIYRGFGQCLQEKDFREISIEDILVKANVSRSTFYAHFKTKDDVLDSLLKNIFHHVFSHSLEVEATHDFSKDSILEYSHLFTHVLYHLQDEGELIKVILHSSCASRFLAALKEEITPLVSRCVKEGVFPKKEIPEELRISSGSESFLTVVTYWFNGNQKQTPSEIVSYYMALNE